MLAFGDREDDDTLSLDDIDLLDAEDDMVGGTYLSTRNRQKVKGKIVFTENAEIKTLLEEIKNEKSPFNVGFTKDGEHNKIDLSTINASTDYIEDNIQRSCLHTHAVLKILFHHATTIELVSYHSLKGFILKVNFSTTEEMQYFKDIDDTKMSFFLIKMVLLTDKVTSYTINKIRKETETYNNFVKEAKIQQQIYRETRNKERRPKCPAVISFFHMSKDATIDFMKKLLTRDVLGDFREREKEHALKTEKENALKIEKEKNRIVEEIRLLLEEKGSQQSQESVIRQIDNKLDVALGAGVTLTSMFRALKQIRKLDTILRQYNGNAGRYADKIKAIESFNRQNSPPVDSTSNSQNATSSRELRKENEKKEQEEKEQAARENKKKIREQLLLNPNVEERKKAKEEQQKALEEVARQNLLKKQESKTYKKSMRGGGLLDASIPIMKELQSILNNNHATIGIIAMEYANNYKEYVKSVEPNVFIKQIISNILIMFLTANVIHCDLHKNNIMVKDDDTEKFVYFIDFGRIYEFNETNPIMKNYKDLLNKISFLTNILNATGDVEKAYNTNTFTIDPKNYSIFDITEPNMSNPVFPTFNGTERLRKIEKDKFIKTQNEKNQKKINKQAKQNTIYLLKKLFINIILYEHSYNKRHFGKNMCQTRHLFGDKGTSFGSIKAAIESNAYDTIFEDVLRNIVLFWSKQYEKNKNDNTTKALITKRLLNIQDENPYLYYVDVNKTQNITEEFKEDISTIIDSNDGEIEDVKEIIFAGGNDTPSDNIMIEYLNYFFEYTKNMCVLCCYTEESQEYWKIHVVQEMYQGVHPEIKLYTMEDTTINVKDNKHGSLLDQHELPIVTVPLMKSAHGIFAIDMVKQSQNSLQIAHILPLAILLTGDNSLEIKNENTCDMNVFTKEVDVNHDDKEQTLSSTVQQKIVLFKAGEKNIVYRFDNTNTLLDSETDVAQFQKESTIQEMIQQGTIQTQYDEFIKKITRYFEAEEKKQDISKILGKLMKDEIIDISEILA